MRFKLSKPHLSWARSDRGNGKPQPAPTPPPPPESNFTQGHRLTLNFIVELLETLRDKQHDYHIDDVLELHIGHLTDIYLHVVMHLKQSSERTK